MKRLLFLTCCMWLPVAAVAQQWVGDTTATNPVYRLGNVGIGLTNPGVALDIDGALRATEGINVNLPLRYQSDLISTYPIGLSSSGSENEGVWDWIHDASTIFTIRHPSSHARSAQMLLTHHDLFFFRKPNSNGSWRDWQQVVTANGQGRVGIGTSAPSVKLEVAGLGRFTGLHAFSIGGDANRPRIQYDTPNAAFGFLTAGNSYAGLKAKSLVIGSYGDTVPPLNGAIISGAVGIGTDSPEDPLQIAASGVNVRVSIKSTNHLSSDGNFFAYIDGKDANSERVWSPGDVNSANYGPQQNGKTIALAALATDYDVGFYARGMYRMNILPSGKAGIGTPSPSEKLTIYDGNLYLDDGNRTLLIGEEGSVSHQIKSSGYLVLDAANGIQLNKTTSGDVIVGSGNVGIGTLNPTSKLAVNGTIKSKEVIVTVDPAEWADYVFEDDYDLRSLVELESFIEENGTCQRYPQRKRLAKRVWR